MATLKEKTGLLPDHKLPTNLTTRNFEVHRWFNFIAGFSPEFVAREIVSAKLKPGSSLSIDLAPRPANGKYSSIGPPEPRLKWLSGL
jgi:hypothetical protein